MNKPSAPQPRQARSSLSRLLWSQLRPGQPTDYAHCRDLIERRLAPLGPDGLPMTEADDWTEAPARKTRP